VPGWFNPAWAAEPYYTIRNPCTSVGSSVVTSAQHIVSIGRDVGLVPAGEAFGPWIPVSQAPAFNCVVTVTPPAEGATGSSHTVFRPEGTTSGEIVNNGASYNVFPVPGIDGLGFIIKIRANMAGLTGNASHISASQRTFNGAFQTYTISHSRTQNQSFTVDVFPEIRLVKTNTGPLPSTLPDTVFDAVKIHHCGTNRWFDSVNEDGEMLSGIGWPAVYALCGTPGAGAAAGNPQHTFRVSLKFHATNATCTTPSLPTIKLPMVHETDFTGPGSTPASGEVPFQLEFINCPPHMTRIHYQLESSAPSPNPALGLVGLTGSSTATGVAVQLVRDIPQRTPHPLNEWVYVSDYAPTWIPATPPATPTTHTINLRARYYQTSNTQPTSGKVQAAVFFHIVYQ